MHVTFTFSLVQKRYVKLLGLRLTNGEGDNALNNATLIEIIVRTALRHIFP